MTRDICTVPGVNCAISKGSKPTYPVEIHALHSFIHAFNNGSHISGHLTHSDCGFDTAADSIDTTRKTEKVKIFTLLSNSVLCIDTCTVVVALLKCLR